jgi:HPt (histidine-containing phosphotransfer) domain-containing protein
MEYIYEMADGEDDFSAAILNDCLNKMPGLINDLQSAAIAVNYDDIYFAAHKLKSSLEYIGITRLIPKMFEMEKLCKMRAGIEEIKQIIADILETYNRAKVEMEIEMNLLLGSAS